MVTAQNTWRRWFFPYLPCRAASSFDLPWPRTTTSVALNSNLVSTHSLWPPQKHGTPYRILLNKSMILLNSGKTWKPIYLTLHTINWHYVSLSVFCIDREANKSDGKTSRKLDLVFMWTFIYLVYENRSPGKIRVGEKWENWKIQDGRHLPYKVLWKLLQWRSEFKFHA